MRKEHDHSCHIFFYHLGIVSLVQDPPVRKTTFELRSHANCVLPFLSLQDLVYVLGPRTYYEGSIKTRGLSSSSYSFLKNLVISRSLVRNTILVHKIQIQ